MGVVIMRKIIIFLKRQAGVEQQVFVEWLRNEHARVIERLPGLRRLTISLEANGEDGAFDGLLECWFDDAAAAEGAFAGLNGQAVIADIQAHVARLERLDLVEHGFVDTAKSAPFKLVAALKRRSDLTRAQFKSWWLDRHAPLVVVFPELRRYQVDLVEDGPECFVDGIAEVSFADLATLKRITSSAQVKGVQEDSQLHTQARYRMFVEEHPVTH
jgi:uncharacterized protein (TIGR02118 family)